VRDVRRAPRGHWRVVFNNDEKNDNDLGRPAGRHSGTDCLKEAFCRGGRFGQRAGS